MRQQQKTEKGTRRGTMAVTIAVIVTAILYALLLELSLNTLPGWGLGAFAFVMFCLCRLKFFSEKGILPRAVAWILLFFILAGIYGISYPPYEPVPAVKGDDPKQTDVITIAQGSLTGVYDPTETVEVYTGIPYAKPPVGELRWKEPQKAGSWDGVRICDHYAPRFLQIENSTLWDSLVMLVIYNHFNWFDLHDNHREPMSEDALYVNIWKPAGDVSDCPVIFFVHGGAMQRGTPTYDQYNGEAFARRGIVFVDFAYRLNIFGYYADEALAEESPNGTTGNYGLLDQIAALSWVHDNISAFGGDPENITIAGESSGSSGVNAICVSPLAKGLFRRAIAESSGIVANHPYHSFRTYEEALSLKQAVYDAVGVSSIEELRNTDAADLLRVSTVYDSMTVDGYAIPEQPARIYEKGENNEEALLNGFNAREADAFTILGTRITAKNYEDTLRDKLGSAAEEAVQLYPPGDHPKDQYNKVIGAAWFGYSHYVWSRYLCAEGRPVYEYWFTRENKGLSSFHAGELPYFYGNLHTQPQNYNAGDYKLSETAMDYIENYVRTGDPNGDGLPVWQAYSQEESLVLELGNTVAMVRDPYLKLYSILDRAQAE